MSFKRNLKQTVTYWAPSSVDVYNKVTWATPVTFSARWEEKAEQFRNKRGVDIMSRAKVYFDGEADIDITGYLFLGTSAATNPTTVADALEIQALGKITSLRNMTSLKCAYL